MRAGRRWQAVLALAIVALSLYGPVGGNASGGSAAPLAAGDPAIQLSPSSGKPGQLITVQGSGFRSFGGQADVMLYFDGAQVASGAPVTGGGAVSSSFRVPLSALPGTHTVTARGFVPGSSPQPSPLPTAESAPTDTPVPPTATAQPTAASTSAVPTAATATATMPAPTAAPTLPPATNTPVTLLLGSSSSAGATRANPTAQPTNTSLPATSPPAVSTNTPVPPTGTPIPATATPVVPTPCPTLAVPTATSTPGPARFSAKICFYARHTEPAPLPVRPRALAASLPGHLLSARARAGLTPDGDVASAPFAVTSVSVPFTAKQSASCPSTVVAGALSRCTISLAVVNNSAHPLAFQSGSGCSDQLASGIRPVSLSASLGVISSGGSVRWAGFQLGPFQSGIARLGVTFTPSVSQIGSRVLLSRGIGCEAVDLVTHVRYGANYGTLAIPTRVLANGLLSARPGGGGMYLAGLRKRMERTQVGAPVLLPATGGAASR